MIAGSLERPVLNELIAESLDLDLVRLLRVATRSLEAENATLARTYSQGCFAHPDFYAPASHGLTYWVGETQLVYEIYKAWIPLVCVRWEAPVYKPTAQRSDLAIYDNDGERIARIFEAKWWGRETDKVYQALNADIDKLQSCRVTRERYLLAFWWADDTQAARDRDQKVVTEFCSRRSDVRLCFKGGFLTDSSNRTAHIQEFTMAMLEVAPKVD